MVNHGVSRGCKTCKMRRKKCDESHPICQRCIKARRTCLGYQNDTDLNFRSYRGPQNIPLHSNPVQSLFSPLGESPGDLSDSQIEDLAIKQFLENYTLTPKDPSLSHGYLDGLEVLLDGTGPSSNLSQATKVVSLASMGMKLNQPHLLHRARAQYSSLLKSFQAMISQNALGTAESLMIALLLGLYEMITATDAHPSNHGSHSYGVYAILQTEKNPVNLLNPTHRALITKCISLTQSLKIGSIFCPPSSSSSFHSLDALLIKSWAILRPAKEILASPTTMAEEICEIQKQAKALNEEYAQWQSTLPKEWLPKTILVLSSRNIKTTQGLTQLPKRIDIYLDLYVAGVWTSYRKTRLMCLNCILRCGERLGERSTYQDEKNQIQEIANDMASSMPYHLFQNLEDVLSQAARAEEVKPIPGKSIGGLFLMHPLFVTACLESIPSQLQAHLREYLTWIGTYMGIGQATLQSKSSASFPNETVANGYTLIWAGMLFLKFQATATPSYEDITPRAREHCRLPYLA